MNKKERKEKYLHRYIGISSSFDGKIIHDIDELNTMLEEDNCYAKVSNIWLTGCYKQPFDEWCIVKVSTNENNVKTSKQLADRVYAVETPKKVRIE